MPHYAVEINLINLDLQKIYDYTKVEYGIIEMVILRTKDIILKKCAENMSCKNKIIMTKEFPLGFCLYITFYFPGYCVKLADNGMIFEDCPDEDTFDKDLEKLFEILKKLDCKPAIINKKEIM